MNRKHPNIPYILQNIPDIQYSKHRNTPYIVQEYLKHQNIQYIIQDVSQISSKGELFTVQYSNVVTNCRILSQNDNSDPHYGQNCAHYDGNMVTNDRNMSSNEESSTVQYSKKCNCVRNDDFDTHYDRYCDHDDEQDHPINNFSANLVTNSWISSRNSDFDPYYDRNYAWDDDTNGFDTHYDRYCDQDDDQDHTITILNEFDTTCTTCITITVTVEFCTTYTTTCTTNQDKEIESHTTTILEFHITCAVTDFDDDPDTVIEFTFVHHGCALYLYVVPILYYDIQYLLGCYSFNTTIYDSNYRIDSNPVDPDLVHYGVVYAYVYENDVAQQLYYNIQHFSPYDNNKCNNNRPKYVILDRTVHIQDDDTVNYVVHDIFRSNNNDMNPNNNDNAMINANCYYDDTNDTFSFYLLWQHVQVRALNDDHNDVIVDHHTSDDDYGIHVIHDTARNNTDLVFTDDDDHNNVLVNNHACDGGISHNGVVTIPDTTCATTTSDPVIESGTIITDKSDTTTIYSTVITTGTTTIFDTVIEFHTIKEEENDRTTFDIDSCTTNNKSTTSTTTSTTIYDITTTDVDDIKCTTDRSTIEEDVDVDNNCDREYNLVHTIKHFNYDISMMILKSRNHDLDIHCDPNYDRDDHSDYDISIVDNVNDADDTDNNAQSDLLYDTNSIQLDDFVCDNTQYYLNNNNAHSIRAIVAAIIPFPLSLPVHICRFQRFCRLCWLSPPTTLVVYDSFGSLCPCLYLPIFASPTVLWRCSLIMSFSDLCFGGAGCIIFLAFILSVSIAIITTLSNNIYNYGYKYRRKRKKKYKLLKQIQNSLLQKKKIEVPKRKKKKNQVQKKNRLLLTTHPILLRVLLTTFCFLNSTLNPFSPVLMIIFMTMGLCWFPGFTHITVKYLFIIYPPYCLLYVSPLVANPFCTSD